LGLVLALLALPALAAEAPPLPTPDAKAPFSFRLFPDLFEPIQPHLDADVRPPETLRIRQPGDPDSMISPGRTGASNELRLLPTLEINDILLKAYRPDPTLEPNDNRFRAAGVFSPLDEHGRPYQFRFGARLVW
jgi:hypothetical protein